MQTKKLLAAAQAAHNTLVGVAQTFHNYSAQHARKNTPESDRKAAANAAHAANCQAEAVALQSAIDAVRAAQVIERSGWNAPHPYEGCPLDQTEVEA